jgi:WD40 repeat protein
LTRAAADVAWHPTKPNIIAASTLNSKINLWNVDLNSRTRDNALQSLEGHTRSANRVKWQLQSAAALLASAGQVTSPTPPRLAASLPRTHLYLLLQQDASVRLWDIRSDSTRSAIPPPTVVSGGNDPIR